MSNRQLNNLRALVAMIEGRTAEDARILLAAKGWKRLGTGATRTVFGKRGSPFAVKLNRFAPLDRPHHIWYNQSGREYLFFQALSVYPKYRQFFARYYYFDETSGHAVVERVREVSTSRRDACPLCRGGRPYFLGPYFAAANDNGGDADRNHGHRLNGMPVIVDYGLPLRMHDVAHLMGEKGE